MFLYIGRKLAFVYLVGVNVFHIGFSGGGEYNYFF